MKLNWRTLGIAVASVSAIILMTTVLVFSQGPGQGPEGGPHRGGFPGGPGGPRGGPLGPLGRDLNLSDEQKTQIKKIEEGFEASTKELRDQLHTLHESEPNPFTTTFDEASVRAAAEARSRVEIELQVAHARMMSQIGALLTAEQKAQITVYPRRPGPPPPPPAQSN